jgi:glycine/D-amino acid oxidase-like deaminating enzyme
LVGPGPPSGAGHNGHGIYLGPGSGDLVPELITDGRASLHLDELKLERFYR